MTLETKRSAMQITQNETQTTIDYKQKNLGLYLIDQYNPLDLSFWYNQIKLRDKFLVFKKRALFSLY